MREAAMREAVMSSRVAATDLITEELERIRQNVPGVRGSIAATSDGLLIAHDVRDMEATQIAALVAALHAVAVRATLSTESGDFKDVITRASEGYLAVFAAGSTAIVAVLGTTGLNVAILNYQARSMIERVAEVSGNLGRPPSAHPAYADPCSAQASASAAAAAEAEAKTVGADEEGALPVRRRR